MQRVVPAILTSDPAELSESFRVLKEHTNWVHIDIMDGKFVPNTSVNLFELGEANEYFNLEIHLMVQDPEKYFEDCKAVGAKRVIFHLEATKDPEMVLQEMEKYPFQRSIAINPKTAVSKLAPSAEKVSAVLLLSVEPGFQEQKFIPQVLEKIPEIRKLSSEVLIGVDGGINEANIQQVFAAGVDYVRVGSAIMKSEDPVARLRKLEEMVS